MKEGVAKGPRMVVWEADECARVHDAALAVLADCGVEVKYAPALAIFESVGAEVRGTRVTLSRKLVEDAIASAPRSSTLKARAGDRCIDLRDGAGPYFGTGSDCPYVQDATTGRRRQAVTDDIEAMAALCERLPNIDFVMSMGLPSDVPQAVDDVVPVAAMLAGTSKPLVVAPRDGTVIGVIKEMAALCGEPSSFAIYAMPSPPLMHDRDALTKVIACAEHDVPLIYCPAPSAGSTAPCSIAGGVVSGVAETLSGLVLHQAVKPGSPFVYGAGLAVLDMRTVGNTYVTPESFLGLHACVDLARFWGLPSFSYAAMSDSKMVDEQLAAESALSTLAGALSRATLLHDVGYLETGMRSSRESVVLGDELIGFAKALLQPVPVDDESLAVDEIIAVGPGGNHLSRPMTRRNHRSFWRTSLFDHTTHDRWLSQGGESMGQRLRERTRAVCDQPRAYRLDESTVAQLAEIVQRVGRSREAEDTESERGSTFAETGAGNA